MPRLILNADDGAYTPGVNRAIGELGAAGALTSATLMASGAAPLQGSGLPVGCHLQFLEGTPKASPRAVSTLLDPHSSTPRLRPTLPAFARDLHLGRIREADIEHEAVAQIRALQAQGHALTHIDTHKHTHLFPRVLRPVLRAALQCGIGAIRNPFEPLWSRQATLRATRSVPLLRRLEVALLDRFRPTFLQLVHQAGLRTPDGALGVLATGSLTASVLRALLQAAEEHPGTWELVCHPGYLDEALAGAATRLRLEREVEREALLAATAWSPALQRISFRDLL
jgi:chitin disaccharide deacetylase